MNENQIRQLLKEISCRNEVEEAILVLYGYSHLYDIHRVTCSCSTKTKEVILKSIEHLGYSDLFNEKDKDILYKIIKCYARTPTHQRNGEFLGKLDEIRNLTSNFECEKLGEDLYNLIMMIDEDYKNDDKLVEQLSEIFGRGLLETEKEILMTVRTKQHKFRKDVLYLNRFECQICGINNKELLIASHSKDWKYSSNEEKLDMYNGLCLCVPHDALYDKGYISFNDDGTIIVSPKLDEKTKILFNINKDIKINIMEGHREYLKWHRENKLLKYKK